jgi:hypothetical protein
MHQFPRIPTRSLWNDSPYEAWESVYQTEAKKGLYIPADPMQRRDRIRASQPKWAEYLVRSTAARQLNRTRLELEISDCRFVLARLKDEIVGIGDECVVISFEKGTAYRMGIVKGVSIFIKPGRPGKWNREIRRPIQTILSGQHIQSLFDQVSKNIEFQPDPIAATIRNQYHRIVQLLKEHRNWNNRRTLQIDRYERQLRSMEPKGLSKELRQVKRYKRALANSRQKLIDLGEALIDRQNEIESIKAEIRATEQSRAPLERQIEESRKRHRLNPADLRRTVSTYRLLTPGREQSLAMLELTDTGYDTIAAGLRNKLKGSARLETECLELRSRLTSMKASSGFKHLTSPKELTHLESDDFEVITAYENCKRRHRSAVARIEQLSEQLLKFKIPIPWATKAASVGAKTQTV